MTQPDDITGAVSTDTPDTGEVTHIADPLSRSPKFSLMRFTAAAVIWAATTAGYQASTGLFTRYSGIAPRASLIVHIVGLIMGAVPAIAVYLLLGMPHVKAFAHRAAIVTARVAVILTPTLAFAYKAGPLLTRTVPGVPGVILAVAIAVVIAVSVHQVLSIHHVLAIPQARQPARTSEGSKTDA